MLENEPRPQDVTFHAPSDRLAGELSDADSFSEEERLVDSDTEFGLEDESRVLPNYQPMPKSLKMAAVNGDLETEINDKFRLKRAERAKTLDSVLAASKAIANAQQVGAAVPPELLATVSSASEEINLHDRMKSETFGEERTNESSPLVTDYSAYKQNVVNPSGDFVPSYTADHENKVDYQLSQMLNANTEISSVESDPVNQRAVGTITRGSFFENIVQQDEKHPKSFVLCMDFSEESKYAMEWAIGTVLVDGSVLYVFNVLEDSSGADLNGIQPNGSTSNTQSPTNTEKEQTRIKNVREIQRQLKNLLALTKLQIHVVVVSCHHPIPKQLIVSITKQLSPTLIIVGSKGVSAIRGVIGGSLSNFLVRRCDAPVMVVKTRLKKFDRRVKYTNQVGSP